MKKKMTKVLIYFIMFFATLSNAQTLSKPLQHVASGWERIYIKDVGSLDLPPTMEIQNSNYSLVHDKNLMYT
jgi:hypothetical protein